MGRLADLGAGLWLTAKSSAVLWCAGVKEAVQLQRCVAFFVESPPIFERTAKCFLLNICVYAGSIGLLHFVLEPAFSYLFALGMRGAAGNDSAIMRAMMMVDRLPALVFLTLWLLPMYVLSFVVNCRWYSEIASMAVEVQRERKRKQRILQAAAAPGGQQQPLPAEEAGRRPPLPVARLLADEIYKPVLFAVFFLQTSVLGLFPALGGLMYFLMTSLLYALYCFDYKWGLNNDPLVIRVAVVESNWAFFMGFGAPCVFCSMVLPFYIGAGVVNFVYPLFVLVACDTDLHAAMKEGREIVPPRRLPWFVLAIQISDKLVHRFGPRRLKRPSDQWKQQGQQNSAERREAGPTGRRRVRPES